MAITIKPTTVKTAKMMSWMRTNFVSIMVPVPPEEVLEC
ncbi:hypothetical protein RHOER0001_0886 [Rhodococcus erythropolis SK121]|nr:hypothetical protein RHOER0001_0886 [Rhodococcus erythropolis SK121]